MTIKKVAVVYLARPKTGLKYIRKFVKSYVKYVSGHEHDLIVLGKGMVDSENIFKDINHKFVPIKDVGFDIHAYINFASHSNYEYLLFCNTYSQIESHDWLLKMMKHTEDPKIGLIGCTGSYESRLDSTLVVQKLNWLANIKIANSQEKRKELFFEFLKKTTNRSHRLIINILIERLSKLIRPKPIVYDPKLDAEFLQIWNAAISEGETLAWLTQFPRFPNPHIRTTGFLIKTKLLVSLNFSIPDSKEACAIFESGMDGLTNKLINLNYDVRVVGADGVSYNIKDWQQSNTFREQEEENVLISDNHVRNWRRISHSKRPLIRQLTWL